MRQRFAWFGFQVPECSAKCEAYLPVVAAVAVIEKRSLAPRFPKGVCFGRNGIE